MRMRGIMSRKVISLFIADLSSAAHSHIVQNDGIKSLNFEIPLSHLLQFYPWRVRYSVFRS
jgi:hypothetical protein